MAASSLVGSVVQTLGKRAEFLDSLPASTRNFVELVSNVRLW